MHLGQAVDTVRRAQLTAWAGVPGDDGITPRAAVAGMLALSWRRAELLSEALRQQVEAANGEGTPGGLIGHRYSASEAAGGIYPTGEQARALVELERAERELVVKFAEAGHRMGIEEARVALAEEHGVIMANILAAALARLGLDPRDPEVRAAVHAELMQLAARRRDDG
jgi:hypothetical protein